MCWAEGGGGGGGGVGVIVVVGEEGGGGGGGGGGNIFPIPCVATTRRVPWLRVRERVMVSPARRPPP